MSDYHIAQLNIAKMNVELDDPIMKDFVDNLDKVNGIADDSPGFVWRLKTEEGDATELRVFEDNMLLVNMSVWESIEALEAFVYDSFHVEILKRKKEWFKKFGGLHQVLWWVQPGSIPDIEEAKARLKYLQEHGESEVAFSFRRSFLPSDKHLSLPAE
jgi:Domain of unknown function (DUF3291)